MRWPAAPRYRTASAPGAADRAVLPRRSERRGCHWESRTANAAVASMPGAAQILQALHLMAPLAINRLRAARPPPCRSAGPKFFSKGRALAAPNRRAPAGWPTGSACVGRPHPGGRARSIGRNRGRSRPATEIPHPHRNHMTAGIRIGSPMPTALSEHYYRKPAAAGPRPGGRRN